jgi:hypothetical protein
MFLKEQDSSKLVPIVLTFRVGKRIVHVSTAELARLSLAQRRKVVRLIEPAGLTT